MLYYDIGRDAFDVVSSEINQAHKFFQPYTLCVEADSLCNLACNVCISNSSPRQQRNDEWINLAIKKIHDLFGPLRIVWSGGEPMLRSELPQQLDLSSSLNNVNVIATNGTKYIPDLKADWIDLSIYGYSESSFQKYTNTKFKFDKIQENLKQYVATYPRVSASFVLGVFENADLLRMVDIAMESGIKRLKFHRLSFNGRFPDGLDDEKLVEQARLCKLSLYEAGADVTATFTRSTSSDHKRAGYWVLKAPGRLTNSKKSLSLNDPISIRRELIITQELNRSLFS